MSSSTLISHLLVGPQPHECLLSVANIMDEKDDMCDDWRRLWSELVNRPLDEAVAKQQPAGPTIFTLKRWVRMSKPKDTTVGKLIKALSAVYRNDAAEMLEQYVQVSR